MLKSNAIQRKFYSIKLFNGLIIVEISYVFIFEIIFFKPAFRKLKKNSRVLNRD